MTPRYCLYLTVAVAAILTGGCARQTRSGAESDMYVDLKGYPNPFMRGGDWDEPSEFKGSGDITIYQDRQKSSAKIDVRSKADGYFSAQVYSPFGAAIAAVDASGFKGSVSAGGERRDFSYGDKMSGLPFPCAGSITFAELIKIMTTGIPEPARTLPPGPVSAIHKKKEIILLWRGADIEARVTVSAKNMGISAAVFQYGVSGETACIVELSRVKNGVAKEISIKDPDSGNYITIKYDIVKTVK